MHGRYASEVDVDFVRRSIKAIGQAAVKIEAGAERCVNVLLDLISTRVSYVVQEAVVVMKVCLSLVYVPPLSLIFIFQDIFRRYPSTYEGVIPTLCANLEELDEPEAKASLIWIIGEYANKIENADELLNIFVDSFTEESYSVRIAFDHLAIYDFNSRPLVVGAVADAHCSCEALPVQARHVPGFGPACPQHGNEGLRFA
jgi:AP-1 complex subunit beta-1